MKRIIFYILIILTIIPNLSFAQTNEYKLIEPLPCVEGTGNNCTPGETISSINLETYIEYVFKFSIALASFLAVLMIIWGGFQIMLSETPFKIGQGKEKIQNAIIGLVMVLASYLILQTIDPRLVNIDTKIKPIKVDGDIIGSFTNQLLNDLDKLSTEKLLNVVEMENQKKDLDRQLADLEAKYQSKSISLDEYSKQKAVLTQQRSKIDISQTKEIAEGFGLVRYKTTIGLIYDPNGTDAKRLEGYAAPTKDNKIINGKLPTDSPNTIQNEYNKQINLVINSDPAVAQQLGNQRDFYIKEVKEDIELKKTIDSHGSRTTLQGQGYVPGSYAPNQNSVVTINKTAELNAKKAEYENNLKNPDAYQNIGISSEQYTEIIKNRIILIDKKLKETKI